MKAFVLYSIFCLIVATVFVVACKSKTSSDNGLASQVGKISPADSQQIMINALDAIVRRLPDENVYLGSRYNRIAKQRYDQLLPTTSVEDRWSVIYALAKLELLAGSLDHSVALFQEAEATIRDETQAVRPNLLHQFYFDLGMAFLRMGETQNCCQRNLPSSCIFPFSPESVHQNERGAKTACYWFQRVLDQTHPKSELHLSAQWLLNVSCMALGHYPESVPVSYRIPNLAAENGTDFPSFRNVAQRMGVATDSLAGGVIADDFDNDGRIDLVVSSFDPREPLRVFWNRGDGTFARDASAVDAGIRGGLNLVQTDFNNDGLLDIFVMRGGWLSGAGKHPNSLLQNMGSRKFVDVTVRSGLETAESYPTQSAAWADFDLDGDLDVYVGNEAAQDLPAPSQLFQNQGDGTFRDVAKAWGVENNAFAKAVTWGDFDGDGDPDLYVSNYLGPNRLYRNDGTKFVDIAAATGVETPFESFPAWFFDANQDGRLDIFVAAYSGGIAEMTSALLGQPVSAKAVPRLYMGQTSGKLLEESQRRNLRFPSHPMGANYGDLNNDGYPDLYLGTGWPELHQLMPNRLYRGGPEGFRDVTTKARVGHLQKGHAVAMADFDNDGDLDIFEQMGGFAPVDRYFDVLYENPVSSTQWIKLKLVGQTANRAAIGARIQIDVEAGNGIRSIYRTVNSGGSFGANPLEQHVGLGSADIIRRIVIRWPGHVAAQEILSAKIGSRLLVVQGEDPKEHPTSSR